ncbi:hypothetical protein AGMMS49944_11620 [Spirochaetia bacterium]|nr:hypothetical protein AGMMS49944_11620 [Spirochaetia bacterium]
MRVIIMKEITMKKFTMLFTAVFLLSGFIFGQEKVTPGITLTGYGKVVVLPLIKAGDEDAQTGIGTTWKDAPHTAVTIEGKSTNVGFKIDLAARAKPGSPPNNAPISYSPKEFSFGTNDFAEVYITPFNWLRLDVGKFNSDVFRGKVADSYWGNFVGKTGNEDYIFTRIKSGILDDDYYGSLLSLTPVEGLTIGGYINFGRTDNYGITGFGTAADAYSENIQIAAGYQIKDIGLVRAQYVGKGEILKSAWLPFNGQRIEAAFALTAVKDWTFDLGIKIPFGDEKTYDFAGSVGVNGRINKIALLARIDSRFAEDSKSLDVFLEPGYNLSFGTVNLPIDLDLDFENSDNTNFGLGLGIKKRFSNGAVGVAFTVRELINNDSGPTIAIPVALEYWF